MNIEDFIKQFSAQFDEPEKYVFSSDSHFQEFDDWNSLMALTVIAMIDDEYNIVIKGSEIRACKTIGDLYELVKSKL